MGPFETLGKFLLEEPIVPNGVLYSPWTTRMYLTIIESAQYSL